MTFHGGTEEWRSPGPPHGFYASLSGFLIHAAQLLAHLSPVEVNDLKRQDSQIGVFLWSREGDAFSCST